MNEANVDLIPHGCFIQLQAVYDTLKRAERKAADLILAHPERIASLNIVDYAQEAGCSEATVVRLSKRLGYEGFPELKRAFDSNGTQSSPMEYEDITTDDEPLVVMRKVFDATVRAIEDTLQIIDPASYQRALESFAEAKTVMFCGVGDAAAVATEAYQRWIRIGEDCHSTTDHDLQLILASRLHPKDVLVAISHSGRTRTVLNVVRQAKSAGATVLAITNYPTSQLAKRSDIVLQTAVFSHDPSGEVMSKRIAELSVIESLFINLLMRRGDMAVRSLLSSNKSVSINKMQ